MGLLFIYMAQRTHADEQRSATESKFYLPAVVTPPVKASRFERIWTKLFDHYVEPPK